MLIGYMLKSEYDVLRELKLSVSVILLLFAFQLASKKSII